MKAVSAARSQPVAEKSGPLSSRLKSGAEDTALNVFGILRDTWADFRSADQFFKYKALIIASWLTLSVSSVFVACPGSGGPKNNIGAELIQSDSLGQITYRIVNNSGKPWTNITVIVNQRFRASMGKLGAEMPDNDIILDSKKLLGDNDTKAPGDLRISDLEVRADQGMAKLLVSGQPP